MSNYNTTGIPTNHAARPAGSAGLFVVFVSFFDFSNSCVVQESRYLSIQSEFLHTSFSDRSSIDPASLLSWEIRVQRSKGEGRVVRMRWVSSEFVCVEKKIEPSRFEDRWLVCFLRSPII